MENITYIENNNYNININNNIKIAVIDTGIDPSCQALKFTKNKKQKIIDIIDCCEYSFFYLKKILTKNFNKKYDTNVKTSYKNIIYDIKNLFNFLQKNNYTNNELEFILSQNYKILFYKTDKLYLKIFNRKNNLFNNQVEDYSLNFKYYNIKILNKKITFSIKEYDNVVSIVFQSSSHGTHVASIIGAYYSDNNKKNGICVNSQLISLKISDVRVNNIETSQSINNAIDYIKSNNINLVNMSFGEHIDNINCGIFIENLEKYCKSNNIIFCTSAGNSGPGYMSVNSPGGSISSLISVGAFISNNMYDNMYFNNFNKNNKIFHFSSRGPTNDGDMGICVVAPGGAISSLTSMNDSSLGLKNGTSMASPFVCGLIANLILQLNYVPFFYWIKNYIMNSTDKICNNSIHEGMGLINYSKLYNKFKNFDKDKNNYGYDISCKYFDKNYRGILLIDIDYNIEIIKIEISINVFFKNDDHNNNFNKLLNIKLSNNLKKILNIQKKIFITPNCTKLFCYIETKNIYKTINGHIFFFENNNNDIIIPVNIFIPEDINGSIDNSITKKLVLNKKTDSIRYLFIPNNKIVNLIFSKFNSCENLLLTFTQFVKNKSFNQQSFKKILFPDITNSFSFNIESGHITEICISKRSISYDQNIVLSLNINEFIKPNINFLQDSKFFYANIINVDFKLDYKTFYSIYYYYFSKSTVKKILNPINKKKYFNYTIKYDIKIIGNYSISISYDQKTYDSEIYGSPILLIYDDYNNILSGSNKKDIDFNFKKNLKYNFIISLISDNNKFDYNNIIIKLSKKNNDGLKVFYDQKNFNLNKSIKNIYKYDNYLFYLDVDFNINNLKYYLLDLFGSKVKIV